MSRFSPFPRPQIFKHRSTFCQKRSLLSTNFLVLVPTAVMATSFKFNLLKTKIKTFLGRTKSICYLEMITLMHFPKITLLHLRRTKWLKQLSQLEFCFAKKHCDTTRNFRAFLSYHVINNSSFFSFFFLFTFLPNGLRNFSPKETKLQVVVDFTSLQNAKIYYPRWIYACHLDLF